MTPTEFKAARRRLGLSARELAEILVCDIATVQAYEAPAGSASAPKKGVNPLVANVMRWMLDGFRPPGFPL